MYSTHDAKHQRGRVVETWGYCWPSKPDLISACLLAAFHPFANVLCWQYLASETVAVSCCFEWELLWHLLCWSVQLQSDSTTVSFSVCLSALAFKRGVSWFSSHLSMLFNSLPTLGGTYSECSSKTMGWFGGRWGILEAVVIPIRRALLHGVCGQTANYRHLWQTTSTSKYRNACIQEPKSLVSRFASTDGNFFSFIFPNWMAKHQSHNLSKLGFASGLSQAESTVCLAFMERPFLNKKHCSHYEL